MFKFDEEEKSPIKALNPSPYTEMRERHKDKKKSKKKAVKSRWDTDSEDEDKENVEVNAGGPATPVFMRNRSCSSSYVDEEVELLEQQMANIKIAKQEDDYKRLVCP